MFQKNLCYLKIQMNLQNPFDPKMQMNQMNQMFLKSQCYLKIQKILQHLFDPKIQMNLLTQKNR
jgi:hypothetical protein